MDEDPEYLAYEELAASASSAATASSTACSITSEQSEVAAELKASSGAEMHRQDGTPLGFLSRDAKQEALRQHKLEEEYKAMQAMWGLDTASRNHTARPGVGSGSSAPLKLAPLGRGRQIVRPAWLTRREQKEQRSRSVSKCDAGV